ncbi:MAG: hypothetical protein J7M24_03450 [Candidatus Latescibacteria bacterium]|nr:hypothetical protein [Candidatus Latescibacterota bacterium]
MQTLRFDYRDILLSPRLAWSFRKMSASLRGIFAAWAVYDIAAYLGLLLIPSARALGIVGLFRRYEFFPCVIPHNPGPAAFTVWIAGLAAASYILLMTAAAVARIAFENLRGNDICQASEARVFIRGRRLSVLVPAVVPGGVFVLAAVAATAAGIVGRIPQAGVIIVAILSIPLFFLALTGVFALIVFLYAPALVPAVAASSGEDALEVLIEIWLTTLGRPVRTFFLTIFTELVTLLSTALLFIVSIGAVYFLYTLLGAVMGFAWYEVFTVSLYRIPFLMNSDFCVRLLISLARTAWFPYLVDTSQSAMAVQAAGWLIGISALFVLAWIASYAFSCFYCSQVIVYLIIRKRLSGDDLRLKVPTAHSAVESTNSGNQPVNRQ